MLAYKRDTGINWNITFAMSRKWNVTISRGQWCPGVMDHGK